jgi:lipopolysaccharide/colanic/teichoic acid biosynthesis glycosyltransferase
VSRWLRLRAPFDRAVASVAAIVSAPLVALLSWRIRRDDGGPGRVALPRVGRGGCVFLMHKLRTMSADDDRGAARGSRITAWNDDRITPIGARLRASHLDELPQLLDVARGRMTLLGPRPETPELVDLDDARWTRVLTVAPGLAGPTQLVIDEWERAQLTGPDPQGEYRDHVLPIKLAVDDWYVANATPWIDFLVVVSLVQRLALGRSSTAIERVVHRAVPATAELAVEVNA